MSRREEGRLFTFAVYVAPYLGPLKSRAAWLVGRRLLRLLLLSLLSTALLAVLFFTHVGTSLLFRKIAFSKLCSRPNILQKVFRLSLSILI